MGITNKIKKELVLEVIIYCIAIFSIVVLFQNNLLLTGVLLIAWVIGIVFWHKKHDIVFFVSGAILGPIGEIICIHFGVWQYANPNFLGIPLWLPFAWGLATIFIKRVAETIAGIIL